MADLKLRDVTDGILRCFFNVYNQLGYGFLKKIYQNAMAIELNNSQYKVAQQFPIKVLFKNFLVGEYFA
jgi:GxxExxY protein